jgi:predicted nucleic acid-binding protein
VPETAVSDTGPILHLTEIGEIGRLGLFAAVIIPEQVRTELAGRGAWSRDTDALTNQLQVEKVSAQEINEQAKTLAPFTVHRTDLSVAALAVRVSPDVVLTDDLRLRRGLESQGHQVVGSVGILIRAFHMGQLSKPELLARLDQLLDGSSLYTSKAFRAMIRAFLNTGSSEER